MKRVALKGKGQSYYLEIDSGCDFNAALADIDSLLKEMEKTSKSVPLVVDTKQRLLTEAQNKKLKQLIKQFPMLQLKQVTSEVALKSSLNKILTDNQIQVEAKIIRSGQVIDYNGNLLLLGDVHAGAQVRATGSIYVVGTVEGIVHAGFPDNSEAIIAGNLKAASQVRISDLFQIVSDIDDYDLNMQSFFYVNDLHLMAIDQATNLKEIRPQGEIIIN